MVYHYEQSTFETTTVVEEFFYEDGQLVKKVVTTTTYSPSYPTLPWPSYPSPQIFSGIQKEWSKQTTTTNKPL